MTRAYLLKVCGLGGDWKHCCIMVPLSLPSGTETPQEGVSQRVFLKPRIEECKSWGASFSSSGFPIVHLRSRSPEANSFQSRDFLEADDKNQEQEETLLHDLGEHTFESSCSFKRLQFCKSPPPRIVRALPLPPPVSWWDGRKRGGNVRASNDQCLC